MQANDGKSASNRGRSPDGKRIPPRSNWLVFFLLLALNYYLAGLFFPGSKGPEPISYTVFRAELACRPSDRRS